MLQRCVESLMEDTRAWVERHSLVDGSLQTARGRGRCVGAPWPLRRSEEFAPFFIIGSGRSGTTLLRRILLSSPKVYIPPELQGLAGAISWYQRYRHLKWPDLVCGCLAHIQFHSSYQHVRVNLSPVYEQCCHLGKRERSLARILGVMYAELAKSAGRYNASAYGDKTPLLTTHAHRIDSIFPDCRFVHVIRNPVDVVGSFVETGLRDMEAAARIWARRTKMARKLSESYPDRCHTVKYEELVTNPQRVAEGVMGFLNVDDGNVDVNDVEHVVGMGDAANEAHHKRIHQPVGSGRIGWGAEYLGLEQTKRTFKLVRSEASRWGYRPR